MLVWMDLEMTGLDHTSDVIVEIATLITDDDLVIIAEGPDLVIHQDDEILARMDPVVVEMHTRSGLIGLIRESKVSLDEAGAATLEFIKTHVPEPRSVPLCGNSIGTDRRFLARYLPAIEDHLHYRCVDVSTVKELATTVVPEPRQRATVQGRRPPRARRHPRQRPRAPVLPRAGVHPGSSGRAGRAAGCPILTDPTPAELSRLNTLRALTPRDADGVRAVTIPSYGGPDVLTLADVADPVPGPDEILVRVTHSACNRADTLQRMGGYPDPVRRDVEILGLEYAGTVADARRARDELGDRRSRDGDRVGRAATPSSSRRTVARRCRSPPRSRAEDAAAIPEVFLTAWDALVVQGGLTSGRWALVHAGASGVGTAAIQIAKAIGARIAVTCSAGKVDACRELGADLVIERSPHDWLGELQRAVPNGVDVVLDVIGGEEADRNLKAVRTQGAIVQVGLMGGGQVPVNVGLLLVKRLTWIGTTLRARPIEQKVALCQRFAAEVLPLFETGALRPVIDSRYRLEAVADAHRHMESNANVGKILLEIA